MDRHPALVVILSITLLFSMTEIYKVTMLGFTVLTNVEKAAHFCTCTGCSHGKDMSNHSDGNMASHEMDQKEQQGSSQPSHCSTNSSDSGKAAVCACKTSSDQERPAPYKSLDKVALLVSAKTIRPSEKERDLIIYHNRDEESHVKEIFHPPKQA